MPNSFRLKEKKRSPSLLGSAGKQQAVGVAAAAASSKFRQQESAAEAASAGVGILRTSRQS
jgi:hypothetical protein